MVTPIYDPDIDLDEANAELQKARAKMLANYWSNIKSLIGQLATPMDAVTYTVLHARLQDAVNNMDHVFSNVPVAAPPITRVIDPNVKAAADRAVKAADAKAST